MKALLVSAILCFICNFAQAVEVTATGYGSSSDEALQNAKVLATEYAASTFVTGKQEVIDGKYKETLGQYNGGLVQKYVVKSTAINEGVYAVTILADVNTDKINEIITNGDTATNKAVPQIEQAYNDINKIKAAWVAISAASDPFVFAVDNIKYELDPGDTKTVFSRYSLHMQWNPKWVDDARQLAKTMNHPIDEKTSGAVCWDGKKQKILCGNVSVVPMDQLYDRVVFDVTLHFLDGTTELIKQTQAYAPATPALYTYNKWFRIMPTWDMASCGNAGKVSFSFSCYSHYIEVESVIIHQDAVSNFNYTYYTNIEKFKTIESVSFSPRW